MCKIRAPTATSTDDFGDFLYDVPGVELLLKILGYKTHQGYLAVRCYAEDNDASSDFCAYLFGQFPKYGRVYLVDLGRYYGRSVDRLPNCDDAVNTGSGRLELESFQLIFGLPLLVQNAGHNTGKFLSWRLEDYERDS